MRMRVVVFQGGNYLLQLMDTYCTGWGLLIIALVECIAVSWVYGKPVDCFPRGLEIYLLDHHSSNIF